MTRCVYKIMSRNDWDDAVERGVYTGSDVDIADGFIHFSTAAQLAETARRHFTGLPDLVVVAIGEDALPAGKLKWEPSRGGDLFPHLYDSLPTEAAAWVNDLLWRAGDEPVLPPELTGA